VVGHLMGLNLAARRGKFANLGNLPIFSGMRS
jgi:hypothetical protein